MQEVFTIGVVRRSRQTLNIYHLHTSVLIYQHCFPVWLADNRKHWGEKLNVKIITANNGGPPMKLQRNQRTVFTVVPFNIMIKDLHGLEKQGFQGFEVLGDHSWFSKSHHRRPC